MNTYIGIDTSTTATKAPKIKSQNSMGISYHTQGL